MINLILFFIYSTWVIYFIIAKKMFYTKPNSLSSSLLFFATFFGSFHLLSPRTLKTVADLTIKAAAINGKSAWNKKKMDK